MKKSISANLILCLAMLSTIIVNAQSLEEFIKANNGKGCESIPYEDLRSRCKEYQSKVNAIKEISEVTCKDMNPTPLKENILRMNDKVSTLQRENDSNKSSASSSSNEDDKKKYEESIKKNSEEIDRLKKEIERAKDKLYNEKQLLEKNMKIGEECLKARNEVQWAFSEARKRANGESDEAKKKICQDLIYKWDKGSDEHKKITSDWERQFEICKTYYSNN